MAGFTDTFVRPDSPTLGPLYDQLVGQIGVVNNQANAPTPGVNLAVTPSPGPDNVLSAIVNLSLTGSFAHAGLVTRHTGPGDTNMYLGAIVRNVSGINGIIYKHDGVVWSELSRGPSVLSGGTLTFEVINTILILSLNGLVLVRAKDSTITNSVTGNVGIRLGNATLTDFVVTPATFWQQLAADLGLL